MARLSTVPPMMHQDILDLTALGLSREKITERLNEKYNTHLDDTAVYKVQKKLIRERQALAQNVLIEHIEETAARDIKIMNEMVESLYSQYNQALASNNMELSLKIADQLNKWHSRSTELTGINKETTNSDQLSDSAESILEKLNNSSNDKSN